MNLIIRSLSAVGAISLGLGCGVGGAALPNDSTARAVQNSKFRVYRPDVEPSSVVVAKTFLLGDLGAMEAPYFADVGHYQSADDLLAEFEAEGLGDEIAEARQELASAIVENNEPITPQTLRLQTGMSQKQVADLLGSSQAYVSKLESGKENNPTIGRVRDLARLYNVDVSVIDQALMNVYV